MYGSDAMHTAHQARKKKRPHFLSCSQSIVHSQVCDADTTTVTPTPKRRFPARPSTFSTFPIMSAMPAVCYVAVRPAPVVRVERPIVVRERRHQAVRVIRDPKDWVRAYQAHRHGYSLPSDEARTDDEPGTDVEEETVDVRLPSPSSVKGRRRTTKPKNKKKKPAAAASAKGPAAGTSRERAEDYDDIPLTYEQPEEADATGRSSGRGGVCMCACCCQCQAWSGSRRSASRTRRRREPESNPYVSILTRNLDKLSDQDLEGLKIRAESIIDRGDAYDDVYGLGPQSRSRDADGAIEQGESKGKADRDEAFEARIRSFREKYL